MKQFILNKEPDNNIIRLEGGDYRHLVRARRLAVGEFFPALLPNGNETMVQVLSVDRGTLIGKVTDTFADAPLPLPPIILFQALPGGDKMDLIVRQAAEGGITEVVPFVSEYSLVKLNAADSQGEFCGGQKFSRWERIIKEARQQCGSKTPTAIRRPLTRNELFDYWEKLKTTSVQSAPQSPASGSCINALGLLFHHQGLEQESLHGYLNTVPNMVALVIGPEGGFSGTEVSLFLENGFKPLTIGDTVLRTETAALYCAAAVRILLLEKNSWELKQTKNDSA